MHDALFLLLVTDHNALMPVVRLLWKMYSRKFNNIFLLQYVKYIVPYTTIHPCNVQYVQMCMCIAGTQAIRRSDEQPRRTFSCWLGHLCCVMYHIAEGRKRFMHCGHYYSTSSSVTLCAHRWLCFSYYLSFYSLSVWVVFFLLQGVRNTRNIVFA